MADKPLDVASLRLADASDGDWFRNIVSLRATVDLWAGPHGVFYPDDRARAAAERLEIETKPYQDHAPLLDRPFSEAERLTAYADAIAWPFEHVCASRFSNGRVGVWYGAADLKTSVHETVYHFRHEELERPMHPDTETVVRERRVHLVGCNAHVADLRPHVRAHRALVDPDDYTFCQNLGDTLRTGRTPGVLTRSARHDGEVLAVFDRETLHDPRVSCYLTYALDVASGVVRVERTPGRTWLKIQP